MCKYYTQAAPQGQKGQEIISSNILQDYFGCALQAYRGFNNGSLPDHIFIYRDGVGDSMRKQVIQFELDQLKKILTDEYDPKSEGKPIPHITLIMVTRLTSSTPLRVPTLITASSSKLRLSKADSTSSSFPTLSPRAP
jgi:hypothetical protein